MGNTTTRRTTRATATATDKAKAKDKVAVNRIDSVAANWSDVAEVVRGNIAAAQEARHAAASVLLMGGKASVTEAAATGNVEKFHHAALDRLVNESKVREAFIDAVVTASGQTLADVCAVVKPLIRKNDVVHKGNVGPDGKAVKGSCAMDLSKAPAFTKSNALARLARTAWVSGTTLPSILNGVAFPKK